jgi:hypothetical protein
MKIKYLILAGALATLASVSAHAQSSYSPGDLFLVIRNLSASQAYVVDLGTPVSLTSNFNVSVPGLNSDVATATGISNWTSSANVYFGVFGVDSSDDTWYATDPSTSLSAAWHDNPGADGIDGGISGFAGGYSGESGLSDNSAAVIEGSGDYQSYKAFLGDGTGNSTAFGYFSPDVEGRVNGALPLYGVIDASATTKGTLEGSFAVDATNNQVVFTAGAVPEPSTIAGVVMGAAALIAARRRRA